MITRDQITTDLAAQRERIERWYHNLSAEQLTQPLTPSEVEDGQMWTAKDHLAHVLGTERFFQGAIKRAIAGAEDPCGFYTATGTDESGARRTLINQANEQAVAKYRGEPAETIFWRFEGIRAATLDLLASITDAQLGETVPHSPFGDHTIGALFLTIAGHGGMHMDWLAKAAEEHAH